MLKKKIRANFQRIIELFTQKIVTKLSKIWVWDPGSEKNLFRIPNPGSRNQKRHRIPDPDPQHWFRIRDILVQVRILGFVPLTNGSRRGSKSVQNFQWLLGCKKYSFSNFLIFYTIISVRSILLWKKGRTRVRTCDWRIRMLIREAQKHTDPTDPEHLADPLMFISFLFLPVFFKSDSLQITCKTTCPAFFQSYKTTGPKYAPKII